MKKKVVRAVLEEVRAKAPHIEHTIDDIGERQSVDPASFRAGWQAACDEASERFSKEAKA